MTVDPERYVVTRTVAARPEQIFAVLADPSRHHLSEPTDWVRNAVDSAPITGTGLSRCVAGGPRAIGRGLSPATLPD
jgi:hypothetical protein